MELFHFKKTENRKEFVNIMKSENSIKLICPTSLGPEYYCTVNFLNIRTPKKFAVVTLKFKQDGLTKE